MRHLFTVLAVLAVMLFAPVLAANNTAVDTFDAVESVVPDTVEDAAVSTIGGDMVEAHGTVTYFGTWFCLGYTAYMGTGPTWYKVNSYYTIYYYDGHTLKVYQYVSWCPK